MLNIVSISCLEYVFLAFEKVKPKRNKEIKDLVTIPEKKVEPVIVEKKIVQDLDKNEIKNIVINTMKEYPDINIRMKK